MPKVSLREARFEESDLAGIWLICQEHFQRFRSCPLGHFTAFCRELWLNNPARTPKDPLGWVLEDSNGTIGGYLGLIPTRLKMGNSEVRATASHSWAVSPAFRAYSFNLFRQFLSWGKEDVLLITATGENVNVIAKQMNVGLNKIPIPDFDLQYCWIIKPGTLVQWGLAKRNYSTTARAVGYFPLDHFVTSLGKLTGLGPSELRFPSSGLSVGQMSSFNEEFDELWDDNRQSYGVTVVRDQASLNWRHFLVPSVVGPTILFACRDGGRLLGYLTLQHRAEAAGSPPGHYWVTDVFYDRRRKDVLHNLFNSAFEYTETQGGSIFQVSHASQELAHELRSQRPYIRKMPQWPYWYKTPTLESAVACQHEAWWPSASDGEANI